MRHFKMAMLPFAMVSVLIALLVNTGITHAAAQAHCGGWSIVASPNPGTGSNYLQAVAAASASNVWAVGYSSGNPAQTLIENWDGSQWNVVPSPNPSRLSNSLDAVEAISASDAWAVGSHGAPKNRAQTLAERWNGTQWSVVRSPNAGLKLNFLNGVAALSPNDAWAVGDYNSGGLINSTLIEHWNGSTWSIIPSPSPGTYGSSLSGVTALASNDAWAVGYYRNRSSDYIGFFEHWNGSQWSVVSSPTTVSMNAIAAVSPKDIWAAGNTVSGNSAAVEHWDGSQWSIVPSPSPGLNSSSLSSVTAISAHNVWAVGSVDNGFNAIQTLTEHWNGTKWSVVPSPNMPSTDNLLYAVSKVPATNTLWNVGIYNGNNSNTDTLTEFYC